MESQDSIIKILDKLKYLEELRIDEYVLLLDVQDKDFIGLSQLSIDLILKMLEKESVIEIHFTPSMMYQRDDPRVPIPRFLDVERDRSYQISVTDKFDDYRNNLLLKVGEISKKPDANALWINYSYNNREIILNDIFILARPNFTSTNELVFSYLYKNPNRVISLKELEREATKQGITKSPHQIVKDLGFKKDLRKAFFNISKTNITFKNPVSKQDLDDLGIRLIKISVN